MDLAPFVPVLVAAVAAVSAIVLALLRRRPSRRPSPPPALTTPQPRASRPSFPPRRVLVVDDERAMTSAMVRVLAEAFPGVEIERAEGGEEALAMLAAAPVDVLVIDVGLRGISGPEVVRRLRERGASPRVLFISGIDAEDLERLAEGLDAPSLAKPFEADALVEAVRELLRG